MKIILLAAAIVLISLSCSKSHNTDIAGRDNNGVYVRIQNSTPSSLGDVAIGNTNYGTVILGATSDYKLLNETIYGPFCQFRLNAEIKYAGVFTCGTPMPPPIEAGYYTFKLVRQPSHYEIEMIKD